MATTPPPQEVFLSHLIIANIHIFQVPERYRKTNAHTEESSVYPNLMSKDNKVGNRKKNKYKKEKEKPKIKIRNLVNNKLTEWRIPFVVTSKAPAVPLVALIQSMILCLCPS